jgi:hypothetical protein
MVKKSNTVNINSLEAKVRRLEMEARTTPKAGPAKSDPLPVSANKTLYINRKVQVYKTTNTNNINITVDDIKGQSSSAAFKILSISAWVSGGSQSATFTLGSDTWMNPTSTAVAYTDLAPLDKLPGVKFDIPDALALPLNTGSVTVINASLSGTATNIQLTVQATIRYQL